MAYRTNSVRNVPISKYGIVKDNQKILEQPSEDWQCGKSLTESLNHLLTSGIESDVTFVLGEEKQIIQAHKLILISRSPVFNAMFRGPMSEKGQITIPDINKETFAAFLKYLYTDQLELKVTNAVSILAVARKYMVDRLVKECESFIQSKMSAKTSGYFMEEAHVHMEENIAEKCLDFIQKNTSVCLKSESFSFLCHTCVERIIASDAISVQEDVVFEAVTKWSEAECKRKKIVVTDENKRRVLGTILYSVRFPLLKEQYFNKHVLPSNLLTPDEIVMVYRSWHSKDNLKDNKFITKRRILDQNTNCPKCRQFHFKCCNCGRAPQRLRCICGQNSFQCNYCGNNGIFCTSCGYCQPQRCLSAPWQNNATCNRMFDSVCFNCGCALSF